MKASLIAYKDNLPPMTMGEERQLEITKKMADEGGMNRILVVVDYGRSYAKKMGVSRFVVRSRRDVVLWELFVAYDPHPGPTCHSMGLKCEWTNKGLYDECSRCGEGRA